MTILDVNRIHKTFDEQVAVDDVSFALDDGLTMGLIGPNGAGKTTTIRMIMNVIIPDSGSITVLGQPTDGEANNAIGYLPEERGMYRKMNVGELLLFLCKLKSMRRRDAKQRIDYWLNRLEIMSWKSRKIEELSKGMQQKVQFIGTILHQPKLLILDEPFSGLDPINANLIKDIIMELKKNGTSIIFSTHVMESAEKLCDRIFMMNQGKQVLSGSLSEIKTQFGRHNVLLEYEGDDAFLSRSKHIKKFDNYGNYVEIQLSDKGDAQKLLAEAMTGAVIRKFEIKQPSLNEIFIATVNAQNGEGK
jgi:ABC-2 type transport system ATP-binding protein